MRASARPLDTASFPLFHPETERPKLVPAPPPVIPGERDEVRELRALLGGKVTNAVELIRALETRRREEVLATMLSPFDALLGGGFRAAKSSSSTGRRTAGRFSIVLSALAASTSLGEAAALIDLGDHFDPQIGELTGIDLRRMLWIRPHTMKQAVMSVEMIAAAGFQTVILDAGLAPHSRHAAFLTPRGYAWRAPPRRRGR